ncbi:MAG TPA: phosphodiester glycosidase family protein, partial [Gaiellaceae bacterium]|nr:phosphodiester glycosidase family protein [Gaiellaceae bacterium]
MRRLLVSLALAATGALLPSAPAQAQPLPLFPGVSYERDVQLTPHGPVAIHVVRGPRPVGLYRLRPALSNEAVLGRETVSSMQRRLASEATMVGVNGDYSRFADGKPSGLLIRDGVLITPPHRARSSLGIGLDGQLDVRRVALSATWRGAGEGHRLDELNGVPGRNGAALFTSDWGPATPRIPGAYAAVLSPFPPAAPNAELAAPVAATAHAGPVGLRPGTAVLVARGDAAARLQAEAPVGATVTVRLALEPGWEAVSDAVGGGPVLVRDGRPVFRAGEAFTTSQIVPRHPRTAIGQRADGRLLLVVVDGRRRGYSVGMTSFELALTMLRLGAVRAMQLDGGGSSTLAFEGRVLNAPSDGRERPIANALMLQYYGVYALPPAEEVVSPNGDGVAETQRLAFKLVRPSQATVTLTAPGGAIAFQETQPRAPGVHRVPFPPSGPAPPPARSGQEPPAPLPLAEGRWTLTVSATDEQGLVSTASRRFWVNGTLGFLRLEPALLRLPPGGGSVAVRWRQSRAARVRVTVETRAGALVRTLAARR